MEMRGVVVFSLLIIKTILHNKHLQGRHLYRGYKLQGVDSIKPKTQLSIYKIIIYHSQ